MSDFTNLEVSHREYYVLYDSDGKPSTYWRYVNAQSICEQIIWTKSPNGWNHAHIAPGRSPASGHIREPRPDKE
jgi:hypothetical protein